jgi:hypothetical protein
MMRDIDRQREKKQISTTTTSGVSGLKCFFLPLAICRRKVQRKRVAPLGRVSHWAFWFGLFTLLHGIKLRAFGSCQSGLIAPPIQSNDSASGSFELGLLALFLGIILVQHLPQEHSGVFVMGAKVMFEVILANGALEGQVSGWPCG